MDEENSDEYVEEVDDEESDGDDEEEEDEADKSTEQPAAEGNFILIIYNSRDDLASPTCKSSISSIHKLNTAAFICFHCRCFASRYKTKA